MRINKVLAQILNISRRSADEFLKQNEVVVNGKEAQINSQINPGDTLFFQERELVFNPETESIILAYKKRGLVCSKVSQFGDKTVFEELGGKFNNFNTVGRLDKDSEGLLLLTNNGDLLNQMTHPKFESEKKYLVILNKELDKKDLGNLENGVFIDGYKTQPITIQKYNFKDFKFLFNEKDEVGHIYYFSLREGRNRQIRKMVESVGLKVLRLIRVQHGEYILSEEIYKKYR